MQVFMFRHAEREMSLGGNPPLNPRGLKQAQQLLEQIRHGFLPTPQKMYCSPKLRAHQTFHPIRLELKVEMLSSEDLDERQPQETHDDFSRRVQKFIHSSKDWSGVVFFVTHLDWLEEALTLLPTDSADILEFARHWPPGQALEFDVNDGLWRFEQSHQLHP